MHGVNYINTGTTSTLLFDISKWMDFPRNTIENARPQVAVNYVQLPVSFLSKTRRHCLHFRSRSRRIDVARFSNAIQISKTEFSQRNPREAIATGMYYYFQTWTRSAHRVFIVTGIMQHFKPRKYQIVSIFHRKIVSLLRPYFSYVTECAFVKIPSSNYSRFCLSDTFVHN